MTCICWKTVLSKLSLAQQSHQRFCLFHSLLCLFFGSVLSQALLTSGSQNGCPLLLDYMCLYSHLLTKGITQRTRKFHSHKSQQCLLEVPWPEPTCVASGKEWDDSLSLYHISHAESRSSVANSDPDPEPTRKGRRNDSGNVTHKGGLQ